MAIGLAVQYLLPVLEALADGEERNRAQLTEAVANNLNLSAEERSELTTRGNKTKLYDRVHWASYFLSRAKFVSLSTAKFAITERGKEFLSKSPQSLTKDDLRKFPEFVEFENSKASTAIKQTGTIVAGSGASALTPIEQIETAMAEIQRDLETQLRERIFDNSPTFFEHLVIDLLVRMGYGGSIRDASVVGRSGDGGIDGVINMDKLGLDKVYVQAKRWKNNVGEPDLRNFAGSLLPHRSTRGVFITTSTFSPAAKDYAHRYAHGIRLIDGEELASLCIEHGVGVVEDTSFVVKKIDEDYFS
jgi:restriction system protein